jgi:transcription-repair coupling factor (superfamily II helicase)
VFTGNCAYFPIKEMVFNVDVTSGEIKNERLAAIQKILSRQKLIVVASIDAIFYRMSDKKIFKRYPVELSPGQSINIMDLHSELIDMGYERVDVIEGKGQFAQRGGIIDIFSVMNDEPCRIEFFGDEIDTIRNFDILTQRSQSRLSNISIFPARETIMNSELLQNTVQSMLGDMEVRCRAYSKKNSEAALRLKQRIKGNVEKLQNSRYFEGIDSCIPYLYKESNNFIDYFDKPYIILDESARITQRIDTAYAEFEETYKALLEKGDILPKQGEYMYAPELLLIR